jgi:replication factor C subunit 2/4
MMARLQSIAKQESCRYCPTGYDEEKEQVVLKEILDLSQGDMRRAVTTLQSAHALSGGGDDSSSDEDQHGYIKVENIAEMAGQAPKSIVDGLMKIFQDPKSNFDLMQKAVSDIMLDGYAAQDVMKMLLDRVIDMEEKDLSEVHKAEIAIKIAEADKCLIDSADESLQLLMICSLILKCFKNN